MKLFGGIFIACSLAGLAALLRSKQAIDARAVLSALLNSGFIGTVIGMAWYSSYKDTNLYFLIAVSILAGLGGSTTLDFALQYARVKFGMNKPAGDETK